MLDVVLEPSTYNELPKQPHRTYLKNTELLSTRRLKVTLQSIYILPRAASSTFLAMIALRMGKMLLRDHACFFPKMAVMLMVVVASSSPWAMWFPSDCKGKHDWDALDKLNSFCKDCADYTGEPNLEAECKRNCFDNDPFGFCVLLRADTREVYDELKEYVKVLSMYDSLSPTAPTFEARSAPLRRRQVV
ncbi:uncharacterized protein LOC122258396 [Penaeus japonicus]|uniref:uncharacterized protein LOC122258396 n=1 Tax=Penaeus japonicus TaxID=27405 RepID=UPI001C71140F|nr:uncharacterized protein LOC122258396 [Penaeus japonicus]